MIIITPTEEIEQQIRDLPELLAKSSSVDLISITKCLPLLDGTVEFDPIYILKLLVFNHKESVIIAAVEELIAQGEYDFLNTILRQYTLPINGNVKNRLLKELSKSINNNNSTDKVFDNIISKSTYLSQIDIKTVLNKLKDDPLDKLKEELPEWNKLFDFLSSDSRYKWQFDQFFLDYCARFSTAKKNIKFINLDIFSSVPQFSLNSLYSNTGGNQALRNFKDHLFNTQSTKLDRVLTPQNDQWRIIADLPLLISLIKTYSKAKEILDSSNYLNKMDWNFVEGLLKTSNHSNRDRDIRNLKQLIELINSNQIELPKKLKQIQSSYL